MKNKEFCFKNLLKNAGRGALIALAPAFFTACLTGTIYFSVQAVSSSKHQDTEAEKIEYGNNIAFAVGLGLGGCLLDTAGVGFLTSPLIEDTSFEPVFVDEEYKKRQQNIKKLKELEIY